MLENFGLYLKNQRELRGISLEEIAGITKIHIRYLEALEGNHFDDLPGEVFIQGFIRSYARIIGSDADEILNAYKETIGRKRLEEHKKVEMEKEVAKIRTQSRRRLVVATMVFLVAGAGVLGYSQYQQKREWPEAVSSALVATVKSQKLDSPVENAALSGSSAKTSAPSPQVSKKEKTAAKAPVPVPSPAKPKLKKAVETSSSTESAGPSTSADQEARVPVSKKPTAPKSDTDPGNSGITASPAASPEKPTSMEMAALPTVATTESTSRGEPVAAESGEGLPEAENTSTGIDGKTQEAGIQEGVLDSEGDQENSFKPLKLTIKVTENSWFNLVVDDSLEQEFILPAGTGKNFYGWEKFKLTIGNREGAKLILNGQPLDLPEGSNKVIRDFMITAKLLE